MPVVRTYSGRHPTHVALAVMTVVVDPIKHGAFGPWADIGHEFLERMKEKLYASAPISRVHLAATICASRFSVLVSPINRCSFKTMRLAVRVCFLVATAAFGSHNGEKVADRDFSLFPAPAPTDKGFIPVPPNTEKDICAETNRGPPATFKLFAEN